MGKIIKTGPLPFQEAKALITSGCTPGGSKYSQERGDLGLLIDHLNPSRRLLFSNLDGGHVWSAEMTDQRHYALSFHGKVNSKFVRDFYQNASEILSNYGIVEEAKVEMLCEDSYLDLMSLTSSEILTRENLDMSYFHLEHRLEDDRVDYKLPVQKIDINFADAVCGLGPLVISSDTIQSPYLFDRMSKAMGYDLTNANVSIYEEKSFYERVLMPVISTVLSPAFALGDKLFSDGD